MLQKSQPSLLAVMTNCSKPYSSLLRTCALAALMPALFACATIEENNDVSTGDSSLAEAPATDPEAERDNNRYLPRIGGSIEIIETYDVEKLEHLRLISIDLVSALVQLPDVNPTSVTLQVTPPQTGFGNLVVRALEDAGYGLQRVSADQGLHYVQYLERFAETDAGPITDYVLRVGDISIERQYIENDNGVYPSSLLNIDGVPTSDSVVLDESIFVEQGGGGEVFVSGVASGREVTDIREIKANTYDKTPMEQRAVRSEQLLSARRAAIRRNALTDELEGFDRLRRTVLIFDNPKTRIMGAGNKQAIRLLVREYQAGDIFQISACTDVDGKNEESSLRGIRVVEEFLSYDIPADSVVQAPCRRASFRHPADGSPVAVEVVHHRSQS